jgi:hypothetical protein
MICTGQRLENQPELPGLFVGRVAEIERPGEALAGTGAPLSRLCTGWTGLAKHPGRSVTDANGQDLAARTERRLPDLRYLQPMSSRPATGVRARQLLADTVEHLDVGLQVGEADLAVQLDNPLQLGDRPAELALSPAAAGSPLGGLDRPSTRCFHFVTGSGSTPRQGPGAGFLV